MSIQANPYATDLLEDYESYRPVSKAAIGSVILGLFSLLGLLSPVLLVLPLAGALLALLAIVKIRCYPQELSGIAPASAGLAACGLLLIGGTGLHTFVYLTEVPEGYQRITFSQLQPRSSRPDLPIPPEAIELNGKKVFVKGYVHPSVTGLGPTEQFILVPDMGTCCFGGQPKLTDMIEVTLVDSHRVQYSQRRRKLGGVLKVDTEIKPVSGLQGVYYRLEADYVR